MCCAHAGCKCTLRCSLKYPWNKSKTPKIAKIFARDFGAPKKSTFFRCSQLAVLILTGKISADAHRHRRTEPGGGRYPQAAKILRFVQCSSKKIGALAVSNKMPVWIFFYALTTSQRSGNNCENTRNWHRRPKTTGCVNLSLRRVIGGLRRMSVAYWKTKIKKWRFGRGSNSRPSAC